MNGTSFTLTLHHLKGLSPAPFAKSFRLSNRKPSPCFITNQIFIPATGYLNGACGVPTNSWHLKTTDKDRMYRGVKLAHIGGLVIFLSSILSFIAFSVLIEGASLENIAFGRKIISTCTSTLTLPGMWIIAVTGVWMGHKRYGWRARFSQRKLLLIILIVLNAYFLVVSAVTSATDIAISSLVQGQLLPEYQAAYMKESMFGALNALLTITAAS